MRFGSNSTVDSGAVATGSEQARTSTLPLATNQTFNHPSFQPAQQPT